MLVYLFILVLFPKNVFGYANFIGHGYNSCITCHYNPFGNGPINDYGRAVSATAISSRGFYKDSKPEDLIGKESGFFFKEPKNTIFRPFASYRGLLLKRNFGEDSETTDYIHMQADLNVVLKYGENDKYISSFSFGYAPVPRALQNTPAGDEIETYRSREHYIGYRPSSVWGFYAGLMDKTYGVKIVEHTAFARTTPQLTMDDQAHGVTVHYNTPQLEGGFNLFVGNLAQDAVIRMKGVAGTFEYTVAEKNRLGLSILKQSNDYLSVTSLAGHIRSGLDNGSSIIFELGRTTKSPVLGGVDKTEYYANFQNHIRAIRGVYLMNSIEYYKNVSDNSYRVRFGPSIQYFPLSKVELRVDVNNTRNFSEQISSKDRWDVMAQIHLWL
ncbi:MAG: hypothetical protein K2Q18_14040 [Bdellovibrionales bacterium]|nr:hypothetical protein [Bdellovibrionales bacterium]